jgi:hypothetical protein
LPSVSRFSIKGFENPVFFPYQLTFLNSECAKMCKNTYLFLQGQNKSRKGLGRMAKKARTLQRVFSVRRTLLNSGIKPRLPSRNRLLAIIMLALVVSPVFFSLKTAHASTPEGTGTPTGPLSMSVVESLTLSNNGYANMNLQYNVSGSRLAGFYREMLGAPADVAVGQKMPIPESRTKSNVAIPVRGDFYNSIKDYQRLSFGFRTWIEDSSMTPRGDNGECTVTLEGLVAPQIVGSSILGSNALVEVAVGPNDDNATGQAVQNVFEQIIYAESLIKALNETGTFECLWTTRMEIPAGAELLNGPELDGTTWFVDFGAGTSLSASIYVDGPSMIVLEEREVVSDQGFAKTPADIFQSLCTYRVFNVRYLLPNTSWTCQAGAGVNESGDDSHGPYNWQWDYNFTWTYHSEGDEPGGTGSVDIFLQIHPNFTFSAFIGWDFDGWFGIVPEWFEAWIAPEASIDVKLNFTSTEKYTYTYAKTEHVVGPIPLVAFSIGPIPVEFDLNILIKPRITFSTNGSLTVRFDANAHAGFKAGFRWENKGGPLGTWHWIWEKNAGASKTGPIILCKAGLSIDPQLGIEVNVLLWDLVGPDLEVDVYGHASVSMSWWAASGSGVPDSAVVNWDVYVGMAVSIGAVIGDNDFTEWLGLADKGVSVTLWNGTIWEWSGTIGAAPTEISCRVDPDHVFYGDSMTIQGNVTSNPVDADKTGDVIVYYKNETVTDWVPIGTTEADSKGNYTLKYTPQEIGNHKLTFMAYYAGNKMLSSAESSTYPSLQVELLGAPGEGMRYGDYILAPTMAKRIITYDGWLPDPHNPDLIGPYPTTDPWCGTRPDQQNFAEYAFYGYKSSYPDQNTTVFNYDDGLAFSWFRMCWVQTPIQGGPGPSVHWTLYDPSGKKLYEVADITNTYQYSILPTYGFNLGPSSTSVPVDCVPPACRYDPNTGPPWTETWDGYCGPYHVDHCWPEWRPWTAFLIDPAWADKGPLRVEVHVWFPGMDYQDAHEVVFNQTFTVTRHPVTNYLWFGKTYPNSEAPTEFGMHGVPLGAYYKDDQNNWLDQVTLQYTTEENASNRIWENWTTTMVNGYIFDPPSPGDYYLRTLYVGDFRNEPAASNVIHLIVHKTSDELLVQLSNSVIFSGDTVTVTASLLGAVYTPLPDNRLLAEMKPVVGKNVTVEFGELNSTNNGYVWYYLSSGTTNDTGAYECSWTPKPGEDTTYQIRAVLDMDPKYADCESIHYAALRVVPGFPTSVEIINGSGVSVERAFEGPVSFQVRVRAPSIIQVPGSPGWMYLTSIGKVEFYVNNVYVGADNDSDGNDIYEINWDPTNWPHIGNQTWTAYYAGVPEFADSMANSTIEVYRSYVDISVANPTITLKPGGSTSFDVTLLMSRGAPDTFNLSIKGLDSSWYKFSNESVSLRLIRDPFPPYSQLSDSETVTLEISLPITPDQTLDNEYKPCLMSNPFMIVAQSTFDHMASDCERCTLDVDYKPTLSSAPEGGLSIFVEPKTIKIALLDTSKPLGRSSTPSTIPFDSNVTINNYESFNDVIIVEINVDGIPSANRASLTWFNWTNIKVFMPAQSTFTIGLQGIINVADIVPDNPSPEELAKIFRIFHATASSTVWNKGYATDPATITVTNTQYNQEAQIDYASFAIFWSGQSSKQIDSPGQKALFDVEVRSGTTEDENVRLTVSGDACLGFDWTAQELALPARGRSAWCLSIAFSGTSAGNFSFTVLNEAWSLSLTYNEALKMGLIETNSFTDYIEVTPQAVPPGASFTYSPSMPMAGDTMTFDASASTAANKAITSYTWDFGDSNTATTNNPIMTHAYSIGGAYNVNLAVTDTDGLTNSTYQTLTVYIQVTFSQAGVGSNFSGTILTVDDAPYVVSDLPKTFTWIGGTPHNFAYQSPLIVGSGAKQYDWTSTTGMAELQTGSIGLTTSGSITGNYLAYVHDVAVMNITVNNLWVFQGRMITVNVTINNKGDFTENVTVTLYYDITLNQALGTQQTLLLPRENKMFLFAWNTKGITYNRDYALVAVATIPLDANTADNTLTCGSLTVRIMGDINGDGQVDGKDLTLVASSFASYGPDCLCPGSPPSLKWNLDCDMNCDNKIDGKDLILIAKNFGKG